MQICAGTFKVVKMNLWVKQQWQFVDFPGLGKVQNEVLSAAAELKWLQNHPSQCQMNAWKTVEKR